MLFNSKNVLLGLLALVAIPTLGFASEAKNARKNDVADKYILEKNGDFYRTVRGKKCQITDRVDSFKVSQHPKDRAMVYFVKDGDLYTLANDSGRSTSDCPSATKGVIMRNVKKYNVVSHTDTTIVNVALDESGTLTAWDNVRPVFTQYLVSDYKLNQNYGKKKASFSSYVLFAINYGGFVMKVKGQEPADSKFDLDQRYNSLESFFEKNKLK